MSINKFYESFISPPEAPIYAPSDEEFKDPLAYIEKIKPCAEKYGAVKIKPPPGWNPPFAINTKDFHFTPRLQKLNELEALNRVRINFADSLAKFWTMQGIQMKIPAVDQKLLDLFQLRKTVQEYGGFEICCTERKWAEVAKRMGYRPQRSHVIRDHYERIIAPYDLHESGLAAEHAKGGLIAKFLNSKMRTSCPLRMRSRMMHCMQEVHALAKRSFDHVKVDPSSRPVIGKQPRELKKLEFFGAPGPKSSFLSGETKPETDQEQDTKPKIDNLPDDIGDLPIDLDVQVQSVDSTPATGQKVKGQERIDLVLCKFCKNGDDEHCLLLCDTCDQSFHTYCLLPPLASVPKGDWRCPQCITNEVQKPREAYGFAQAERIYTLHTFGEMANRFKSDYFGMPAHLVPCSTVEKEFWRLVNTQGADGLTVEYGADLLTDEVGSGFPKITDKNLDDESTLYAKSPWNLNNLPVLKNSVLSHINFDISGMKVPWIYIGMVFSTFCWHTEDHWSYSINYLHWGEPKTWYAASGLEADQFESAMKEVAPELFLSQPDLLHHLVTLANPRLLMDKGVRIHTVNQGPGEFVITFPRAYHTGFNQGFNCAEAVNFCPADWLARGRQCVEHYSYLRRMCVFSHDELLVNVTASCDQLEMGVAWAARDDLKTMIDQEAERREHVKSKWPNCRYQRALFEQTTEEERQCIVCSSLCFLSAAHCACTLDKIVCLRHVDQLCDSCPSTDFTINYRYDEKELEQMLARLNHRVAVFDQWCQRVKVAFDAKAESRMELGALQRLLQESEEGAYPWNELRKSLASHLKQIDKCSSAADQLIAQKIHSNLKSSPNGRSNKSRKLRFDEVEIFVKNLNKLPCHLPQTEIINKFIAEVRQFKENCYETLSAIADLKSYNAEHEQTLSQMLDRALGFDLQLPEITKIKSALSILSDFRSKSKSDDYDPKISCNTSAFKVESTKFDDHCETNKSINDEEIATKRVKLEENIDDQKSINAYNDPDATMFDCNVKDESVDSTFQSNFSSIDNNTPPTFGTEPICRPPTETPVASLPL